MEWTQFGVRDAILLLVAAAAIYLVVMLLKLTRIGRRRQAPAANFEEPPLVAREEGMLPPLRHRADAIPPLPAEAPARSARPPDAMPAAVPPAPIFEWGDVKDLFGEESQPPAPTPPEPPPAPRPGGFGEHLADHLARTDMEMEVQRMRDEMERMREEMEELRAARRVSPQYAEAMELAQRGLTAQDVADRLGISLAEAELVYALSRGRQDFDEGEDHGANGYATGFDEHGQRRPR